VVVIAPAPDPPIPVPVPVPVPGPGPASAQASRVPVPGPGPASAQASRVRGAELSAPLPDGLVRDDHTASAFNDRTPFTRATIKPDAHVAVGTRSGHRSS
jgi:hypothetical protein